jgi:hypothetical protein
MRPGGNDDDVVGKIIHWLTINADPGLVAFGILILTSFFWAGFGLIFSGRPQVGLAFWVTAIQSFGLCVVAGIIRRWWNKTGAAQKVRERRRR